MDEYQQDPEPPLNDEVYQMLRSDSLLMRIGSSNFAALVDPVLENDLVRQQQQQQPEQHHHQQPEQQHQQQPEQQHQQQPEQHMLFPSDPALNDAMFVDSGLMLTGSQLQFHDPTNWDRVDLESEVSSDILDAGGNTSSIPDSTPTPTVPSLQPWPGQYDFTLSLPLENKDRNKWCFSKEQNKLYLCPNIAVPINVKLLQWIDASITITPVFKESRHRIDSVFPCYNCKSRARNDTKDHLVNVDGQECDYKVINERFVVSVPLHPPLPGEVVSTMLVRLTCLTSCIGGPNRRPFCLVFTLHDNTGAVIGRQVLDLKCCKCPSRDMANEDKAFRNRNSSVSSSNLENVESRKRSVPVPTSGEKRSRTIIKLEPGTEQYTTISFPARFAPQVKRYVNGLIGEEQLRLNNPNKLLFPEDEL